jgi:hypothetical protein
MASGVTSTELGQVLKRVTHVMTHYGYRTCFHKTSLELEFSPLVMNPRPLSAGPLLESGILQGLCYHIC